MPRVLLQSWDDNVQWGRTSVRVNKERKLRFAAHLSGLGSVRGAALRARVDEHVQVQQRESLAHLRTVRGRHWGHSGM